MAAVPPLRTQRDRPVSNGEVPSASIMSTQPRSVCAYGVTVGTLMVFLSPRPLNLMLVRVVYIERSVAVDWSRESMRCLCRTSCPRLFTQNS